MKEFEKVVGLVIRSAPGTGPSSRDQLDVALSAASLGYELELFFTSQGIQQLVAGADDLPGGFPIGHKGWKALSGLTDVLAWADPSTLAFLGESGNHLLLSVEPLNPCDFARRLDRCDHALVI